MEWIASILGIVSNFLGLAKGVQDAKNAPEMKANKEAEIRSQDADKINQELQDAHGKTPTKAQDDIRKTFSED